ncbi:hypothetical protein MKX03_033538 [Papaver bracteatum]|nr:hypothetical protein MKX03_033538 [Papaver bracteatum]
MVQGQSSKNKKKRKSNFKENKTEISKKPKGDCFYCKNPGHYARDCRIRIKDEKDKKSQVNIVAIDSENPSKIICTVRGS